MAAARLEHVNMTVTDPRATAAWIERVFGWKIRWEGPGMTTGYTVHIGDDDSYVALFTYPETPDFMAEKAKELVAAGVSVIGGCCGTTPAHIRAIKNAVR